MAIRQKKYRGIGIGAEVMNIMIQRMKKLDYHRITDSTVYKWNTASQRMHEKLGFKKSGENEKEFICSLEFNSVILFKHTKFLLLYYSEIFVLNFTDCLCRSRRRNGDYYE